MAKKRKKAGFFKKTYKKVKRSRITKSVVGYGKSKLNTAKGLLPEMLQLNCLGYGFFREDIMKFTEPLSSKIPINPMWQDNVTGGLVGLAVGTFIDRQMGIDIIKGENTIVGMELKAGIVPHKDVQSSSDSW